MDYIEASARFFPFFFTVINASFYRFTFRHHLFTRPRQDTKFIIIFFNAIESGALGVRRRLSKRKCLLKGLIEINPKDLFDEKLSRIFVHQQNHEGNEVIKVESDPFDTRKQ